MTHVSLVLSDTLGSASFYSMPFHSVSLLLRVWLRASYNLHNLYNSQWPSRSKNPKQSLPNKDELVGKMVKKYSSIHYLKDILLWQLINYSLVTSVAMEQFSYRPIFIHKTTVWSTTGFFSVTFFSCFSSKSQSCFAVNNSLPCCA